VSTSATPSAVADQGDLRRAGATGALWQGLAVSLSKCSVLITTVVLARLLTPGEFGLVALALVVVTYAQTISDAGVAQALIYLPARTSMVRAGALCAAVVGTALMVLAIAAAPLVADFFHRPDVAPLVRLCAVSLLAAALGSVPESLLRRDLLFSRITVSRVVSAVATAVVSIALAAFGSGAWAIAWGQVAGSVAFTLLAWLLLPGKSEVLHWRTTWTDIRAVLAFGVPAAGGSLLGRLVFDADYIVIGRLLGAQQLAFYTFAFKIPEFVILNVFFVVLSVVYPLYNRAREDPERLRRGYLFSVRLQALYGVAAGAGLAVIAPLTVHVLFGSEWAPAAAPLTALALYAALRTVGGGANEIYKAIGRPGISVTMSVARLVILVPVLVFATRWGIGGVAWALVAVSAVFALAMQGVAMRVLGLGVRPLLVAVAPAFTVAPAAALVAWLLARLPLGPAAALALAIAGGAAAGVAVLVLVFPAFSRELLALTRRRATVAR
jgi:PST family polysaccharide transporter